MNLKRWPAVLVIILFLLAGIFAASRFVGHDPIDTDILSLLPGDQNDPVLAAAIARANEVAANRVALLVEGGSAPVRKQAVADLTVALVNAGLFRPSSDDAKAIWEWAFSHRGSLLCRADRLRLQNGGGQGLMAEALQQWYSPFSISNSSLLKSDPMLLTPRVVGCIFNSALPGKPLQDADLISGSINTSVFRLDVQDKVTSAIASWQTKWAPKGLVLSKAGAIFHAAYGAERARLEMSFIGGITLIAILILYGLIFRTLRPPVLAVLLIGCCLTVGLAVTLAIFSRIHVMVMVFAAALIGMVVDYTTYYLVTGIGSPNALAATRRKHIYRPLTLGMATSVGAFAALLFFPISAFQQIAVFGCVGLVAAWMATMYLLPFLEGRTRKASYVARWLETGIGQALGRTPQRPLALAIVGFAAILAATAWLHGGTLDNVRAFQTPSASLAADEAHIRELTGFTPTGMFFLVTGSDRDQAIAHEEALLESFEGDAAGTAKIALAASALDPSIARIAADRLMLRNELLSPYLDSLQATLGMAHSDPYAQLENPPSEGLPDAIAALRGQTASTFWSIVPLAGASANDATLERLSTGPYWALVDAADRYSELLARYRFFATLGLCGAAVTTGIVLLVVYRSLSALWIMLPTVLAMTLTPSIMVLAGLPYSFFSAMGLFLVIGAGVDYGIFQWEHPASKGRWTRVGIVLAATMTCISVGMLGWSSVLPVKSFGAAVAIGIFLSLVLSPLARLGRSPMSDGERTALDA